MDLWRAVALLCVPATPGDLGQTRRMVLGCGRSGTSIFGELFDGLAGYAYRSEPRARARGMSPRRDCRSRSPPC